MYEKDVEKYFRKVAKAHDCKVYKWASPGNRGVPDDIVFWPGGRVDFVELKTPKGSLKPLQRHVLSELTRTGQDCYVLRGTLGVDMYFKGTLPKWEI